MEGCGDRFERCDIAAAEVLGWPPRRRFLALIYIFVRVVSHGLALRISSFSHAHTSRQSLLNMHLLTPPPPESSKALQGGAAQHAFTYTHCRPHGSSWGVELCGSKPREKGQPCSVTPGGAGEERWHEVRGRGGAVLQHDENLL